MLDLYGEKDLDYVLASSKKRKDAGSKNKNYSQLVVKDADHFFVDMNIELVTHVNDWLMKH